MKSIKKLVCNQAAEHRFVQVVNQVNTSMIRRETAANGDNLIIIPSYTLPDDVVMNGGLYPKHEIENSFKTLEGTPAPIGHPVDDEGNFASARSEIGIDRFHAGVWNTNVQRKDNRIYVEKRINERVAMQSEIGKKLIDRVNKLLSGESDQPIHTSVGVFLEINEKQGMINNQEYSWVAQNMEFDHDAILLDEEGAATPKEGVGMMVNKNKKLVVNRFVCDEEGQLINPEDVIKAIKNDKKGIWSKLIEFVSNIGGNAENEIGHGGRNSDEKGKEMKLEDLIKSLRANGVTIADNATEAQVTEALNKQLAANKATEIKTEVVETPDFAAIVANAISPLTEKLNAIEAKQNAQADAEKDQLIESLKGDFEETELKAMSVNTLQKLAAKKELPAYHFNSAFKPNAGNELASLEMPNVEVK